MLRIGFTIGLLIVALSASTAWADYDEGMAAYKQQSRADLAGTSALNLEPDLIIAKADLVAAMSGVGA